MPEPAPSEPPRKDEDDRFNPASDLPGLTGAEKRTISSRSRPNAALVHETIRAEGQSELERSTSGLLFSSVAAGLSIGFSLIMQALFSAHLPDAPWRTLVSGLGYPIGFLIVVMGRQQLFTENTLTPVLELLYCRNLKTLAGVGRLWGLVLLGNLVGAWLFAYGLARVDIFPPEVRHALGETSRAVYSEGWGQTFAGAVFAGWLIATMVWLLPSAGEAVPLVIIIMTYVVGVGRFGHSIAGSVEGAYLVWIGQADLRQFLLTFFVPTVLGNIVGGVALVAVLNYGQVASEVQSA